VNLLVKQIYGESFRASANACGLFAVRAWNNAGRNVNREQKTAAI